MPLASADRALSSVHDLAMLDLDGVVYVGGDAVPGAKDALSAAHDRGMRMAYLTNNASRRPATVADHLRDLGMPLESDEEVITSAQAVARLVAETVPRGAEVLLVGGDGLQFCLEQVGLKTTRRLGESTCAVVQGFSPDLTWADLAEASFGVHSGLPWFASNTDLTFPAARGAAPGNGSLVQAVANATRRFPVVAGKPERALFDETLTRLSPRSPLMIGDRLDTDIEGANALGISSLAVLTGVSSIQDLAEAGDALRPGFVAPDLAGLLVPHPPVDVHDRSAVCADARVHVVGEGIEVVAPGKPLHRLRAVIALAWTIHDDIGQRLRVPGEASMQ